MSRPIILKLKSGEIINLTQFIYFESAGDLHCHGYIQSDRVARTLPVPLSIIEAVFLHAEGARFYHETDMDGSGDI